MPPEYIIRSDRKKSQITLEKLSNFQNSFLEVTCANRPSVHLFGRLKGFTIYMREGRIDIRINFTWTAELMPDGEWKLELNDYMHFDYFFNGFLIDYSPEDDPTRMLLYCPRAKLIYIFDKILEAVPQS